MSDKNNEESKILQLKREIREININYFNSRGISFYAFRFS